MVVTFRHKKGEPVRYVKDREAICLTEEQVRHIYKKVESGSEINVDTIKQEMEDDRLTRKRTNEEKEDTNPHQKVVLNNVYKDDVKTVQMEYWSILSNIGKYVQHDEESKIVSDLHLKTLDCKHYKKLYDKLQTEERQTLDMDFGDTSDMLRTDYLDMYGGVQADVVYSTRFDECSDLSMTYLGRTHMMSETKIKAEEKFPISGQGYTMGKLLDNTDCKILLETGASKSYMSKSFYLKCKTLHALPKFASNTQRIQVGNGQYVSVLFVIPVIADIHGHRF